MLVVGKALLTKKLWQMSPLVPGANARQLLAGGAWVVPPLVASANPVVLSLENRLLLLRSLIFYWSILV
jgi:hypothetical protein